MNKEELKKLEEKISYLTSALDAAIDDYFKNDCSGETTETENIHENLNIAWDKMDAALDEIECLLKGATRTGKQDEPQETELSKITYRAMLRNITPETIQAAHKATLFFDEQLDNEEEKKLSPELKGILIASLLIQYGKLTYKEG